MPINEVAAAGFGRAADAYERARPDYPAAALERIASSCGIAPGRRVLDLACGTGKLTRALTRTGAAIVGADPIDAMLHRLRAALPDIPVVRAAAESLPFKAGSFDAVTIAQGFHWFDGDVALDQIARVLSPAGWLALIWNVRDTDTPWVAALSDVFARYEGDAATLRFWRGAWRAPFERTTRFSPLERIDIPHAQRLSREGVIDRVLSVSFIATLPDDERARVVAAVEAILDADPATRDAATIVLPYVTQLYLSQRIS